VTSLLLVAALVAAMAAMAMRRAARGRARRALRAGPGSSAARAIAIRGWDDMASWLRPRPCPCGARLALAGEGSRAVDGRRYRVARLVCDECDEAVEVFFDTTGVLH
jgi:hypothetical protein